MHPLQVMEREPLSPPAGGPSRTSIVMKHNLAPKAEFCTGNSNDTFDTSEDGDDGCSLVGAEMTLDLKDHDGDGQRPRSNSNNSLPAMRASDEFANLHDLAAGGSNDSEVVTGGGGGANQANGKEQERKWWWQKPSAEEADEQARATVHHDDSDNCAGARHGEDGEETTRDEEVVSRRRSLDHQQPIMRRASIGGMFGGGWMQPQQKQTEQEPEVDAEQAWANATWGNDSTRRVSADNAMDKAAERLDQQQQPEPKPRARRATMPFGIMGELPNQHDIHDTQQTPTQPQNNRRPSLAFGPTSLFRGIGGAGASESNEPSSEEFEQKRRAAELEDQSLSDMLAMLKAQRNLGRTGHANKTCTNVANAVIVKEYMEVQRRASMSFANAANAANSSSAAGRTSAAGSDVNLSGNGNRRQAMPKRASKGFNMLLDGFGRNNQERKEQSRYEDSYSNMTELSPVRPVPTRSTSLRLVTERSSSLTRDGGVWDNGAEAFSTSSSIRPPGAARRSSMN